MSQQLEGVMTELDLGLAHKAEQLPGFTEQPGMVYALGGCFTGRQGVIIGTPALTGRTYYVAGVGMLGSGEGDVLDYRHPATAGWLLELLGPGWALILGPGWVSIESDVHGAAGAILGEACISAAIARGGWGVR